MAVTPEGFLGKRSLLWRERGSDGLTAGRVLWAVAFPVWVLYSALVLFDAVPNVWLEDSALSL